jgi:hypothetical protein
MKHLAVLHRTVKLFALNAGESEKCLHNDKECVHLTPLLTEFKHGAAQIGLDLL